MLFLASSISHLLSSLAGGFGVAWFADEEGTRAVENSGDDCVAIVDADAGCEEPAPVLEARKAWNCCISISSVYLRWVARCRDFNLVSLRR